MSGLYRNCNRRAWSLLLLCVLALPTLGQSATGYHRAVSFSAVGQAHAVRPQGLFVFESAPEGFVERLCLVDPQGGRWVLTGTLLPATGSKTLRWTDDASGEWVELRYDLGFKTPDLTAFFDRAYDVLDAGSGNQVRLELHTSRSQAVVSGRVPTGDKVEAQAFLRLLLSGELAEDAAASVPADFFRAAPYLRAALDDLQGVGYTFLPVIEIVDGIQRGHGVQPSDGRAGWRQAIGEARPGLEVKDEAVRRFLEKFRSIDPAAPLADHRLHSVATSAE